MEVSESNTVTQMLLPLTDPRCHVNENL